MAYEAEISRSNPSAFVVLLDQSSSMIDAFGGSSDSKAVEATRIVNGFLMELAIKCNVGEGIHDYFEVAVIGYGGSTPRNAFAGMLGQSDIHPISQIGENPYRLDQTTKKESDGAGGIVEVSFNLPIWVVPTATGTTPMRQALNYAGRILRDWVVSHPDSFPPTVLNVTDGEANDGNPAPAADEIKALSTNDGNALVFNCHVSSNPSQKIPYPSTDEDLPDQYARQLFAMSSELPPKQLETAKGEGFAVQPGSRGFVLNADVVDLISFIEIGTRLR